MNTSSMTVLTYHRVFDVPDGYQFDRGVIDVGPEAFDAQLKLLSRYFNVVGIDELCAHYAGEEKLPPNPAVITFDDGYLDNLKVAAPILKDNGMRGVFFIATNYITDRRVFWWDQINYLSHHAAPGSRCIELTYPTRLTLDFDNKREEALGMLLQFFKFQFGLDIERILNELAEKLNVPWNDKLERELCDGFVMNWDQVRELRRMGMDVESHTSSHRSLQTVPLADLKEELSGAKTVLERELGEPIRAISYPIGRSISQLPAVYQALRDAGYQLGFTNSSGTQSLSLESDCLDLNRIAIEPEYQGAFFRGVLALPQLRYNG